MTRYSIVLLLLIVLVALCVLVRLEKTGATTMAADSPPILLASLPMTPFVLDPLLVAALSRDVAEDTPEEDPDREEEPSSDVAAITKTYMEEKVEELMDLSGKYEPTPETLQREEEQEAVAALVIDTETGAFKNPPIELFPGVRIVSLAPLGKQPLLESAIKRSRGMLKSGEGEGEAEGEGEPDPFATLDLQSDFIAFLSSFFEDYSSGMEDTFDFNAFTVETIDDMEEILPAPNGIPDLAELLVLETFLKTPALDFSLTGGPSHQSAVNRWQYFETLYGPVSDPSLAPVYRVGLAYSCLDDFMAIYLGAVLLSIATEAEVVDFANLIDAMETTAYHFSQSGDIDGDQYSALIEWQQYGTGQTFAQAYAAYESAVLNPAVYPSNITLHTVTRTCGSNVILLYPAQEKVADGVTLTQYATFGYDEALFAYDPYFDHWVITGESPVSPRYSGADTIEVLVEDDVTIQQVTVTPDLSVTVSFPDSALEAKVRTAINKPSGTLLLGDVYTPAFTELQATNAGIVSLEGLQHCRFLKSLWLGRNSIVSLTPLSTLYRLNGLDLGCNQITDLSALANLHDLTDLELGIMFLNYLFNPNLVNTNRPANLAPLTSLLHLEYLGLTDTGLQGTALAPFAASGSALDALPLLSIGKNPGLDLTPLASLDGLLALIDHDSNLTNTVLAGLSGSSSLMAVYLFNNNLESLAALSGCTDMLEVDVSNNPSFSVVPNTFPDMRAFGADNCALSDITNLGSLSLVSQLSLSDNDINDITPLLNIAAFEENAAIDLIDNPLAHTQSCAVITALRARGVEVQENAAQCRHTLTYSAGPNGSIAGTSPQIVYIGENGSAVEAVPDWGYYFLAWSDDETENPRTDTNVTEDITVTAIFAPYQYTLNYLAGDHGSIDGLTPQLVDHGEDGLPVTAVPDYGYHFTDWDDGRIDNPRIDTANTEPLTVYASFDINQYYLNYLAGPNGTIFGDSEQLVTHGDCGTAVEALPDTGYHFSHWSDGLANALRTDCGNTEPLAVTASFQGNLYTVSFDAQGGSTPSPTSKPVIFGDIYGTLPTTTLPGHFFDGWWTALESGVLVSSPTRMLTPENHTLYARWTPQTASIFFHGMGASAVDPPYTRVTYGQPYGTLATASRPGYIFDGWWTDPYGGTQITPETTVTDTRIGYYLFAHWTQITLALTYLAGDHGSIEGEDEQTVPLNACGTAVTAVPDPGYHFELWSDLLPDNPRKDCYNTEPLTVTAGFAINQYTLAYAPGDYGTLSGNSYQVVNHGANGTAVQAIPYAGRTFVMWSDGVTDNPRTDTEVTGDINVTAVISNLAQYTLHYAAGSGGYIQGEAEQCIPHGTDGTAVMADAEPGYHFVQWSDGRIDNPRIDTNVLADKSVTASFSNICTLIYSAGEHGQILGTSPQVINHGDNGSAIIANPAEGYHFTAWSDGKTDQLRADKNVTSDINVTAHFAVNTYTLIYMADAHGSISGVTPQTINHGANGTEIIALPDSGYHFVHWNDGSTDNPRNDTNVLTDITVMAIFSNTYTLTYTAGEHGSIAGTTPQTVNHGGNGTSVTALPDSGYHFVQWSDGVMDNTRTDTNVTVNKSVTASFAGNVYTLIYAAGEHGSVSGTTPQTVNHGGNGTSVSANSSTGYHFVQWSDGVTDNPRTDTNVTANKSVTATFTINTYTLNYSADEHGSISGTTPQTVNHGGNGTSVTANPSTGYHFVQWSDGVTDNPRTDTNVTANKNVTATFAINIYTLSYSAGEHGSLSGTTPQTVNHGGNGTSVSADPSTGYHFVQWSDGVTANPRTDTNVTANKSVAAVFTINTYTLTYTAGQHGQIYGTSQQTVNHGEDGSWVCALQDNGYKFTTWNDGITNPLRKELNVTADKSVTASFAENITIVVEGGGVCTADPQAAYYTTSAITVTPNVDWQLDSLVDSVDGVQSGNYTTSLIYGPRTITATFTTSVTYNVTCAVVYGSGTITASPQQVYSGQTSVITVTPASGWHVHKIVDSVDGEKEGTYTTSSVTANRDVNVWFYLNVPEVTDFMINGGDAFTDTPTVTLNNTATYNPTHYMASESSEFTGASWLPYSTAPSFTLCSPGMVKTVYFKVKNQWAQSTWREVDSIFLAPGLLDPQQQPTNIDMVTVASSEDPADGINGYHFVMGNSGVDFDASSSVETEEEELPPHPVHLDSYHIGKYVVTNQQFCDVLNWARQDERKYLRTSTGGEWLGTGDIYTGGQRYRIYSFPLAPIDSAIKFVDAETGFVPNTADSLEGNISLAAFPAEVNWFGAAAFCNWLSEWQGLLPCYDMSAVDWPINVAYPSQTGYRLPTRAEWECAAAWDKQEKKHWVFGTQLSDSYHKNMNYFQYDPYQIYYPILSKTTPVGFYNGSNIVPRSAAYTFDSPSPAGCYDMSGNVAEWCGDWYTSSGYGSTDLQVNPTGPATGTLRTLLGGNCADPLQNVRTAYAEGLAPDGAYNTEGISVGFRIARNAVPVVNFSAVNANGYAPLTVQFTDESVLNQVPLTSRLWNFGDGHTSDTENPSHTYSVPGSYTVSLDVTTMIDTYACTRTKTKDNLVTVQRSVTADFTKTDAITPPAPDSDTYRINEDIAFYDLSTTHGPVLTAWNWDFGDGSYSTDQNPAHAYSQAGTYDVTLIVTAGDYEDTITKTDYVTVVLPWSIGRIDGQYEDCILKFTPDDGGSVQQVSGDGVVVVPGGIEGMFTATGSGLHTFRKWKLIYGVLPLDPPVNADAPYNFNFYCTDKSCDIVAMFDTVSTPSHPSPSDGATGVTLNPLFCWKSLPGATCSITLKKSNLADGEAVDCTMGNDGYSATLTSGSLEADSCYEWQVTENGASGPVWSFTTGGPTITGVPFERIVIGDEDGFGWADGADLVQGGITSAVLQPDSTDQFLPVNGDGNGILGPGDYLPDMDQYDYAGSPQRAVDTTPGLPIPGDDWDRRATQEARGDYVSGQTEFEIGGMPFRYCGFGDAACNGSQFTDITLSTSYDEHYRLPLLPFPNASSENNRPVFEFDFTVNKTTCGLASATPLFLNFLFGDLGTCEVYVKLTPKDSDGSPADPVYTQVSKSVEDKDGLIQGGTVDLSEALAVDELSGVDRLFYETQGTASEEKWHAYLKVEFVNEAYEPIADPYMAFDFAEISVSKDSIEYHDVTFVVDGDGVIEYTPPALNEFGEKFVVTLENSPHTARFRELPNTIHAIPDSNGQFLNWEGINDTELEMNPILNGAQIAGSSLITARFDGCEKVSRLTGVRIATLCEGRTGIFDLINGEYGAYSLALSGEIPVHTHLDELADTLRASGATITVIHDLDTELDRSKFDILYIGVLANDEYLLAHNCNEDNYLVENDTRKEMTALWQFIKDGGGLITFTEQGTLNLAMEGFIRPLFSVECLGGDNIDYGYSVIVAPDHLILDGPFGNVDNLSIETGGTGNFWVLACPGGFNYHQPSEALFYDQAYPEWGTPITVMDCVRNGTTTQRAL